MRYQEYPSAKGLKGILLARAQNGKKGKGPSIKKNKLCKNNCNKNPLLSSSKGKKGEKKTKGNAKNLANYCLELNVPDEARWRICHKNQDRISALHTKLIFYALNANFKGNMSVISNFLTKSRIGREAPLKDWHWENQHKWNQLCRSTVMQSPLNIIKNNVKKPGSGFSVSYNLLPVYTMMKRNQKEVIAAFMNFGGLVQLSIGGTYVLFTPTYMSFRFPGEHTFEGKRYMGEIVLHLVEMSSQRVT